MPRHVAFLRGINLGNRRVKNDELRSHFEAMEIGLEHVDTYLASGNVIFDRAEAGGEALEERIEEHLEEALGYDVDTFLRSLVRLTEIAKLDALRAARDDGFKPHVIFLKGEAGPETEEALGSLESEDDRFRVLGGEVAWLRRGGLTDSPITTRDLEAALGVGNTMRNLNTVQRIVKKFGG